MKTRKLSKGNIVTVYEDPLTRQKEEGSGRLVKIIDHAGTLDNGYERWMVDFDDGYGPLQRTVHSDDFVAP